MLASIEIRQTGIKSDCVKNINVTSNIQISQEVLAKYLINKKNQRKVLEVFLPIKSIIVTRAE